VEAATKTLGTQVNNCGHDTRVSSKHTRLIRRAGLMGASQPSGSEPVRIVCLNSRDWDAPNTACDKVGPKVLLPLSSAGTCTSDDTLNTRMGFNCKATGSQRQAAVRSSATMIATASQGQAPCARGNRSEG